MRLVRPALIALAASCVTLVAGATLAEAQTQRTRTVSAARPLTVPKRSFLDLGKVVPVGTESRYVQDQIRFQRTPDYYIQRGRYGNETLPGPFDLPGY